MKPHRRPKPDAPRAKPSAATTLPTTINSATFEKLSGLSERRLRQLADGGKLPQPKAGRWQTVESVRALVGHYRSQATSDDLERAKIEKLETENRLLLMEEQERNDELISFSAAVEVGQRGNGAMVSHIMGWTEHPVELREAIILEIRKAGDYFHSQLVAERKKHENTETKNPEVH